MSAALGKTILIVEDEILSAMSLRDELEDAGYRVLDITDRHQQALAAAQADKPDLALVNIDLSGDDDGVALARDLKVIGVPVLFISGQVSRAQSARTVAVGSLPKPYSPVTMVEAVGFLLAHLSGNDSVPCPEGLEVFDESGQGMEPITL